MTDALNERFAIAGHVAFEAGKGGLVRARITNGCASAEVYLHGAHVTSFHPRSADEVLWLSDRAVYASGRAIRGGIPVCWPWFGPHPSDGDKPQHGFARVAVWEVVSTAAPDEGRTRLCLRLPLSEETRALFPHDVRTELSVTVGSELTVELSCRNVGGEAVVCGGALHTYLAVADVAQTRVLGLEGCDYLDQLEARARKRQQGPVEFSGNVDRIYLVERGECVVEDGNAGRRVHLRSAGSGSTVVWNPWKEKAAAMSDFPDDGYRRMVCVEAANAADDVRTIAPGKTHVLSQTISPGAT